jgi:hypothetical protein
MAISPERAAAIEAAIDTSSLEQPAQTPAAPEPKEDLLGDDPDTPATDAPAEPEPTEPEPTEPADEPADETAQPASEVAGPQRGPDGKFVPKDGDAAKEGKPAPAGLPPPDADVVEAPVPDGLKRSTREYVERVRGAAKEARVERDRIKEDFEVLIEPIRESGATPEQFKTAMQLLRLLNSPDPLEQTQALQQLQGAAAALAQRLGHVPPGADPLDGQKDLLDAVNAGQMPRQYAEEVAKARLREAALARWQKEQQARQQAQQHQTAAQAAAIQQGRDAVAGVEAALKASDPHYASKVAMLKSDQAFMAMMKALPPSQWAATFAAKYAALQLPAAARPAASPQPLRAKTPAGSVAKEPSSVGEAIRALRETKRARA